MSFVYKPLGSHEIRVFVLHPGCDSDPLCGHLILTTMSWGLRVRGTIIRVGRPKRYINYSYR